MTTSLTPDTGTPTGTEPPGTRGGRTTATASRRRALTWGDHGRPDWRSVAFGRDQPRWARPSAFALVVASGFLYLWNLTNSGWANEFYAAAIQAGSKDWTAWFFGSLDAGNAITVDKPPAAFWIPGLLGRVFALQRVCLADAALETWPQPGVDPGRVGHLVDACFGRGWGARLEHVCRRLQNGLRAKG